MITKPIVFVPVALAFFTLSAVATVQHGFSGIFAVAVASTASAQVFADLAVALLFALTWLKRDAEEQGLNPWPWIVATPAIGSISPLLYLGYRHLRSKA